MIDALREFVDRPTGVVSGGVCLELFPEHLDSVFERAVGRQEMQDDRFQLIGLQRFARCFGVVGAAIVVDQIVRLLPQFLPR